LSVELDKLIFFKELKNKDKIALLNYANRIVKKHNRKCINDINLHNYDLEVFNTIREFLDSNDKKIPRRLSQNCLPPTSNGITSKILPMTEAISKFKYNVAKDESYCDPLNMLLPTQILFRFLTY
jgi:L-2-hydroxyglutarate oxidase LhgO